MRVLVALAVIGLIGTATAIQCFQCNSQTDTACHDHFNYDSPALREAFMVTCDKNSDGDTPFCRKIKTYIERVDNSTVIRIQRDCGYKRREGYDCYQKRSEDYVMDTCQCDGELCNAAPVLTTSIASFLAVFVPFITQIL